MGWVKEFKEFAMKGNVVDLAVGIIIGGAFGKIVSSLVADVIMPPIGYLIGGMKFTDLKIALNPVAWDPASQAVTINIGNFIQSTVDFVFVAFAIFIVVKLMNTMKRKQETAPATPSTPPADVVLLTEIRDLLKSK